MGVNILTDEIAFYPVLYWPVLPDAKALPEATLAKIDAYMKQGGLIIFDTQDYGRGLAGSGVTPGVGESALQRIIGKLDVPRLEPVPENHVLTKAFYLLRNFPGRWDGGQLWVEALEGAGQDQARRARVSDGVTSIIVTPNDLAAAWALDERGRPLYPDRRRRRGPARNGLPHRHQHRHARADRQLQSRPGARAGAARTARAMRHSA